MGLKTSHYTSQSTFKYVGQDVSRNEHLGGICSLAVRIIKVLVRVVQVLFSTIHEKILSGRTIQSQSPTNSVALTFFYCTYLYKVAVPFSFDEKTKSAFFTGLIEVFDEFLSGQRSKQLSVILLNSGINKASHLPKKR